MDTEAKEEFITLIAQGLNDVMIPALENMEARLKEDLASKEDLQKVEQKLSRHIDSLARKFDAQQDRLDKHNQRIEILERLHPQGRHQLVTV